MGHRVFIVGGGFGGLHAARALKGVNADITLIDKRNFHLFQPLLYQVATGSLSPADICAPLRGILSQQKNVRVLLGEAADFDPRAARVTLSDGAEFPYDSLIVAAGAETSYSGRDDWAEYAPSLKNIEDATAIRRKILYAFEAAERAGDEDERRAWLTFVIVGAGATGVELAGAVGEIANYTLKRDFRSIRPEEARILLLDGAQRALPSFPPELSAHAENALLRLGVRLRSGVQVESMDSSGVMLRNADGYEERYDARTVLWAGGVVAAGFGRALASRTGAPTDRRGRFLVESDFSLPGYPSIFVVGDLASVRGPDGIPLPGVAPVAMQSGAYVAARIRDRLRGRNGAAVAAAPFRYVDKGDLAVIGRGSAVANIFGLRLWGWPAWLVWLFVHLLYLVQFQSRLVVLIQWGFQYLSHGRRARLITGEEGPQRGE